MADKVKTVLSILILLVLYVRLWMWNGDVILTITLIVLGILAAFHLMDKIMRM